MTTTLVRRSNKLWKIGGKIVRDPGCCCCSYWEAWLAGKCIKLTFTGDLVGEAILQRTVCPEWELQDTVELTTGCMTGDGLLLLTTARLYCVPPPATGIALDITLVPYPAVALYCIESDPWPNEPGTIDCEGTFTATWTMTLVDNGGQTCTCTAGYTITATVIDCP